jgi:NitT/TauT family transport system substrate-binding protein
VGRHLMVDLGASRLRTESAAGMHVPGHGLPAATAKARRFHRAGRAVAVIGLVALTAGCTSSPGPSSQPGRPEKTSIVVGAVPAADSAGLYIAQQRGFFAAAGLHVKIVNIVSAEDAITTQISGGFDVTLGNYVSYIEADAEQHAGLRIIAEGSVMQPANQEIVTLPGSRITTLAGLRGATLAVNVRNNIGTILIGSALNSIGLPLRDVKLVPIPFPLMTAALKDHQVAAAWLPEPFLSSAEQQIGARDICDLDEGGTAGFPIVGYAVTRAWEQKFPRTAAAFARPGGGSGGGRFRPRARRAGGGGIPGRVTADGRAHGGPRVSPGRGRCPAAACRRRDAAIRSHQADIQRRPDNRLVPAEAGRAGAMEHRAD